MKNILEAPFMVEMIRTVTNMYGHTWDERNGGNISLMLDENDVDEYLDTKAVLRTITTGFTAGIAVTIAIGQVKDFLGLSYPTGAANVETIDKAANIGKNISTFNYQTLLVGLLALAIQIVWPKINKKIPGSLIAVIVGVCIVKFAKLEVNTIGDL